MPLAEGEEFAGYTIVRLLGSGGMGEVYLARHPRLPRQDALKVLPAAISSDKEFRERFNREADLAATLWHPHIVGVHDRGEFDGRLWISMDYVEGLDAARLSREEYPEGMPVDEVMEIVSAVAEALDYAHERNLLHRDVKPANILLSEPRRDERRRILLADFGIARHTDDDTGLTATNMTIGSVSYTAPEQLMGENIDLIGMDSVIERALSKDPNDRYDTCLDFANSLAQAGSGKAAAETTTQFRAEHIVTAPTPPVEPTTTVTEVAEPTVQHSVPPPTFVSNWGGSDHPPKKTVNTPPPIPTVPPPSPQVRLDPLLVVIASVFGIALVAALTFITLEILAS